MAANLDRVLVVMATADPAPVLQLMDRLLVIAEANDIPAAVVVNKADLAPAEPLLQRARHAGYPAFATSTRTNRGVPEFAAELRAHTALVTGPSGAGKSSLLNAVQPGLGLRVGEISRKVKRGRQTTVGAIMVPLEGGGYLVDTPGFSEAGLWGVEPRALAECFPEFRPLIGRCRYADCRHASEPGCAVGAAAAAGLIAADRFASYHALLAELHAQPPDWA